MFNPGDRFRVGVSSGTIIERSNNFYLVQWDHHKGLHRYPQKDADLRWKIISSSSNVAVNESGYSHVWKKYVGFSEAYDYCDCGEKKI